jgi:hypothetical protein
VYQRYGCARRPILRTTIRATLKRRDGERTKILSPLPKCHPFIAGGHAKQVSDDWETLGSRRKRVTAPFAASGNIPGYQTKAKDDYPEIQEKFKKHIGRTFSGALREEQD